MTLSELKNGLQQAKLKLDAEKELLETQRQLAAAGKHNMLAFQHTSVAKANLDVINFQNAINKIEDADIEARIAWHQNQQNNNVMSPEEKIKQRENDSYLILSEFYKDINGNINEWRFLDVIAAKFGNYDFEYLKTLYHPLINKGIIRSYGRGLSCFITVEGEKWLADYNKETVKETPIIQKTEVHNHYRDKVEIKGVSNSTIGDVLQSSNKPDEKSKYKKEIILLIVGAILTLIVALIGSYTQHWFGWNK